MKIPGSPDEPATLKWDEMMLLDDWMALMMTVKRVMSRRVVMLKRMNPPFYRRFFHNSSVVVFSSVIAVSGTFVTWNLTSVTYNIMLQLKSHRRLVRWKWEWSQKAFFSRCTYPHLKKLCRSANFDEKLYQRSTGSTLYDFTWQSALC